MFSDNVTKLIHDLKTWKDQPRIKWHFDLQFYLDEDGVMWGDHYLVFAVKHMKGGRENLLSLVRDKGLAYIRTDFTAFTGLALDVQDELSRMTSLPAHLDKPDFARVTPRDVARTLLDYQFNDGRTLPSWSWLARDLADHEFMDADTFARQAALSVLTRQGT